MKGNYKQMVKITLTALCIAAVAMVVCACGDTSADSTQPVDATENTTEPATAKAEEINFTSSDILKSFSKDNSSDSVVQTEKSDVKDEKSTAEDTENSSSKADISGSSSRTTTTSTYSSTTVNHSSTTSKSFSSTAENKSPSSSTSKNEGSKKLQWHDAVYKTVEHKAEYKKVWVVDKEAYTYEKPIYVQKLHKICDVCSQDITDGFLEHRRQHLNNNEEFTWYNQLVEEQIGSKTVSVPEKGHYDRQLVTEAWSEKVLVREAGYY